MGEEKKKSLIEKIFIGVWLLLAATFATLATVRLQPCHVCAGKGQVEVMKQMPATCPRCDGEGKIPLLNDWRHSKPPEPVR